MASIVSPVVVVGSTVIDLIPLTGSAEGDAELVRHAGGPAANIAVGLAALGDTVEFVGSVGDDENGHFLRENLHRNGVGTTGLVLKAGKRTSVMSQKIAASGDRRWHYDRSVCSSCLLAEADLDVLEALNPSAICIGASSMRGDPARGALVGLAERWHSRAPLYLTTNVIQLRASLDSDILNAIRHIGRLADMVFTTYGDNAFLGLRPRGTQRLVYTRGSRGAALIGETGEITSVAGHEVEAVDPSGAADVFVAAFIRALRYGFAEQQALAFANATAALSTTREGVRGIPVWQDAARLAGLPERPLN
ncbi:MAG: hypothetical protein IT326_05785 [Anaerolineae bacterium]|nr:hypothetical protein [Anaerolineae bacterium]